MFKTFTPTQGTAGGTTTLSARILGAIHINKILVGTLIVKDGATVLGTIAIGAPQGTYFTVGAGGGIAFGNLVIVSSSASDDFTVSSSAV